MSNRKGMPRDWAEPVAERFMRFVQVSPDCWVWTGNRHQGYGQFLVGSRKDGTRRVKGAHVVSYELFNGEIPSGLELDHLCRNRACVNPAHLEAVPHKDNCLRSPIAVWRARKARTHCKHGHEYSEANTHVEKDGSRSCRTCDTNYERTTRHRANPPEPD
jgi:hypothetical protein